MRELWTDHKGRQWPLVASCRRLKFNNPSHAALRAFVHHRDGYKCLRCSAVAFAVPTEYDGRFALESNQYTRDGYPILLAMDHVLTLKAGGRNTPDNLQTLCETCNRRKIREDNKAAKAYRGGLNG